MVVNTTACSPGMLILLGDFWFLKFRHGLFAYPSPSLPSPPNASVFGLSSSNHGALPTPLIHTHASA